MALDDDNLGDQDAAAGPTRAYHPASRDNSWSGETVEAATQGADAAGPNTPDDDAAPVIKNLSPVPFVVRTLRGDVRDRLLDYVRNLPKQWHALSEKQQRKAAVEINDAVTEALTKAVEILAAEQRVAIKTRLATVKIGDKLIEGKITLDLWDDQRHKFFDACGKDLLVVISDAQPFMGQRAPAKVDPEEPPLPLETLQLDPNEPRPGDGGAAADPPVPSANAVDQQDMSAGGARPEPGETGAFELGRQARRYGKEREENHFEPGSPEAVAWENGYDEEALDGADDGDTGSDLFEQSKQSDETPPADAPAKRGRGRPRKDPPTNGGSP